MKKLDPNVVMEAVGDLADLVRSGSVLHDEIIAEIAEQYEIQPEVLRRFFFTRHPEGKVTSKLPTMEEKVLELVREALSSCNRPTLNRKVKFHGEIFTLICLVDESAFGPAVYEAIRHIDGARVELPYREINRYLFETRQSIR